MWRNKSLDFDKFHAITRGDNESYSYTQCCRLEWMQTKSKKTDIFSKRLLYKFLGGRSITETTGIILVCFDGKYTWAYKKILKIWKVCLRTYCIEGHLKQPRGQHAARGLGSLDLHKAWEKSCGNSHFQNHADLNNAFFATRLHFFQWTWVFAQYPTTTRQFHFIHTLVLTFQIPQRFLRVLDRKLNPGTGTCVFL